MSDVKLEVLEEWFRYKLWDANLGETRRLAGLNIKVTPGGCLVVVKAVSGQGPEVAFYQAPSLDAIRRLLSNGAAAETLRWRPDQFVLDKKS